VAKGLEHGFDLSRSIGAVVPGVDLPLIGAFMAGASIHAEVAVLGKLGTEYGPVQGSRHAAHVEGGATFVVIVIRVGGVDSLGAAQIPPAQAEPIYHTTIV